MFKVGDKVYYIGMSDYLSRTEIFNVTFVRNNYISISDLNTLRKTSSSIPLWEDIDFINVVSFRKDKIDKIKRNICLNRVIK